ncbi:uncharacterized protein LOC129958469 [Argiope bruennichi]|uniref:uncharacterized protein LOC129958469 n=1 Tax=Argiope bruennichi TaxID=94029 RepID=UPI002494D683|nr:uncharacterized protein LOC129958469 [Argiope bruennichi]
MASAEVGQFPEPVTTIPCWAPWWAMPPDLNHYQCHMGSSSNVTVASSNSRFMIISTQNTFHRISPFLVNKLIQSTIGEVQNIKKLRSGDLLLQTSEKQAVLIGKLTKLGDFPIQTALHNFSRGVISEPYLIDLSDEDLVTEFSDQHVCAARRINVRRDGQLIPTKHIVLTFQTPVLPKSIKAGHQICRVRPYIPNPLRCFKCQRYGHSQQACRSKTSTCAKCAETGHDINNCISDTMKCVNCSGPHTSFSKSCPKWTLEKEVISTKIRKNISFAEARKLINDRTLRVGVSFSDVLKATLICSSAQTDSRITQLPPTSSVSNQSTKLPEVSSVSSLSSNCPAMDKITKRNRNNKTKISTSSSHKTWQVHSKQRTKKKVLMNRHPVAEDFLKAYTSSSEFSDMELDPTTISKIKSGGERKKKPPDKSQS